MGSRRVVQYGAFLMIVFAVIGKFGAVFATIPDPVIGGVFCCVFGLITAVGISNLQYVDLNSLRNLLVFGFSIIMGMVIPNYMRNNPGAVDTGKLLARFLGIEYKYVILFTAIKQLFNHLSFNAYHYISCVLYNVRSR